MTNTTTTPTTTTTGSSSSLFLKQPIKRNHHQSVDPFTLSSPSCPLLTKVIRTGTAQPCRVTQDQVYARTIEKLFQAAQHQPSSATSIPLKISNQLTTSPCYHCQTISSDTSILNLCTHCDHKFCGNCINLCQRCDKLTCIHCYQTLYTEQYQEIVCWTCTN